MTASVARGHLCSFVSLFSWVRPFEKSEQAYFLTNCSPQGQLYLSCLVSVLCQGLVQRLMKGATYGGYCAVSDDRFA